MKKWGSKQWLMATAVIAFAAILSFVQIGSYKADKNNLNGFWIVATVVLGLVAVYGMYRASKGGSRQE